MVHIDSTAADSKISEDYVLYACVLCYLIEIFHSVHREAVAYGKNLKCLWDFSPRIGELRLLLIAAPVAFSAVLNAVPVSVFIAVLFSALGIICFAKRGIFVLLVFLFGITCAKQRKQHNQNQCKRNKFFHKSLLLY